MTTPTTQVLAPYLFVETVDLQKNVNQEITPSETDFFAIKQWLENTPQPSSLTKSLLMPIRTNRHLIEDLLFPINSQQFKEIAHAVNNVVLGQLFFAILFFISLTTLPIRCITVIPRALINLFRRKDPFHEYLKEKVSNEILAAEKVTVALHWYQPLSADPNKKFDEFFISKSYPFIEVPDYPHSSHQLTKTVNHPEILKKLNELMLNNKKK